MADRPRPDPPPIAARLAAAAQALARRDYQTTQAICHDLLKAAPKTAEAHFLLGVVAADYGDFAKALDQFNRALEDKPDFSQAMAQGARALMAMGRAAQALEMASRAETRQPQDAYTLDTLGVVYTKAGLHERAAGLYALAARIQDQPGYHYNHAAALQFLGRFDEARSAYRACIKGDPRHVHAWSALILITQQTREANDIAAVTRLAETIRNPDALHLLGHALAKAHEDLGEFGPAIDWLRRAKATKRDAYDPAADEELFAAAQRSLAMPAANGFTGASPVFVVGMPRTGTTLVERILTNHSALASAGELNHFPAALKRSARLESRTLVDAKAIGAAASQDPAAIGRDFVDVVQVVLGLAGRFVDKLPLNFFLVPHILRALPQARVICLRRNAADAVLSNYRQPFADMTGHLDYTSDLEAAARYYVRFDQLTRAYSNALPAERYCEVWYEDIIADLESETRRLLAFCGLEFEADCLNFQDNASPVATASAAQVRQPLYSSSVGRWKNYRPSIDPALAILRAAGCMPKGDIG